MSTDRPRTNDPDDWRDCRPPQDEGGCDPSSSIDERKCRDAGLTAQLEYTKAHSEALEAARDAYAQARTDYREHRHEAALKVQDMKHQVKHLLERIRCLIEQDRVIRCLDQAFCEVEGQLDCCEGPLGCCVQTIEFDPVPPESYRKLQRRIAHYQAYVDSAKACFDVLVLEPGKLTERVDAAKADLDAIMAALADDAAKIDLKKQYATALVLKRRLERIWLGYADNAAYVDCLCLALTTWSAGVEAVSLLTGAQAMQDCQRAAAKAWCEKLTAAPVVEILVIYDRLCGSDKPCASDKPSGSDDSDEPDDPEHEHPEDCGCGHHHHGSKDPESDDSGDCGCGHHHHNHHEPKEPDPAQTAS